MSFVDTAGLERELAQNLRFGRAFLTGAGGVAVLSDCTLVLVRADGAELRLTAQAVMVSDAGTMCGIGLELRPFGPEVLSTLEAFTSGAPTQDTTDARAPSEPQPDALDEQATVDEPVGSAYPPADAEDALDAASEDTQDVDGDDARPRDVQQQVTHERLRKLSQVEQQKVARSGDLSDRVMLERIYGKAVWEGLLHNPKLTVPEVARMAQKGTMPRPMVDFILDNATWVQQPSVRRALLGNPRVSSEGVLKILRATPKHELKVITKSTAYAAPVREAARKLLKA